MALFHDPLWLVPTSVFLGGIIGSPHCLSMCGPIVLNFASHRSLLIAYQLGRMFAYTVTGAVVGALGASVLGPTRPIWLSGASLILIAIILMINGYRVIQARPLHLKMPKWINHFSQYIWKKIRLSALPRSVTAALAGLFTVFLPCGHLYSFLLGAVATGSAYKGAAFMFAFWLGSAPLLSFGGSWLQRILRPQIEGGQRWAGVLLIIAGLFSVVSFASHTDVFHSPSSAQSSLLAPRESLLRCH